MRESGWTVREVNRRTRILIVDDEDSVRAAMVEYFGDLGYEVDWALDASAARYLVERGNYAVVITDLCLSRGDRLEGLDLIERIRSLHPQTPCIVLTAYGSWDNEKHAYRQGAAAFIQKPKPLSEIAHIVARLASRSSDGEATQ